MRKRKKRDRLYIIWTNIKQRIFNKNCREYKFYGGRGLLIEKEWADSFLIFSEDVTREIGEIADGMTIDRINNDIGYFHGNIRWSTMKQQANNRRSNVYLDFKGEKKTIAEWSDITGISQSLICVRINKLGWSIEKTLSLKAKEIYQFGQPSMEYLPE